MTELKMPLTICRISNFFYPGCCGVAINSTEISKRLVLKGHKVYLLTYTTGDIKRPLDKEKIFGVHVIRLKKKYRVACKINPVSQLTYKFNRGIEYLVHFFKIFRIVRKSDVVFLYQYTPLTLLGAISAKLAKKPYILKISGSDVWRIFNKEVTLDRRYRFVINKASYIISVSKYLKKKAIEAGIKRKIVVVPSGVDLTIFEHRLNHSRNELRRKLNIDSNSMVILNIQGLNYRPKGMSVKNNIQALHYVLKKHPNAKLLIIGDGPLKNYLQKFAKKLNLSEKVIFAGWIPHEQLPQVYALADIFLLTSPLEGLPTVVLEAMAMKKPVLTAMTGGQSDFIVNGENGLFIDPNSPKEIAKKICFLIEREDNRTKLGQMARKTAIKNFNWDKIIHLLIKLIEYSIDYH